jgi:hypothetical protein
MVVAHQIVAYRVVVVFYVDVGEAGRVEVRVVEIGLARVGYGQDAFAEIH